MAFNTEYMGFMEFMCLMAFIVFMKFLKLMGVMEFMEFILKFFLTIILILYLYNPNDHDLLLLCVSNLLTAHLNIIWVILFVGYTQWRLTWLLCDIIVTAYFSVIVVTEGSLKKTNNFMNPMKSVAFMSFYEFPEFHDF